MDGVLDVAYRVRERWLLWFSRQPVWVRIPVAVLAFLVFVGIVIPVSLPVALIVMLLAGSARRRDRRRFGR